MHRSIRTIKRWRKAGMPMTWQIQHGQRVRVVDENVLFAQLRARLDANPAHQWRLRRIHAARTLPPPPGAAIAPAPHTARDTPKPGS